jgi:hypothetical protein
MKRLSGSRPSPALVVGVLALVAALAGTAVAGPTANTAVSKKKTKKIALNQANKVVDSVLPLGAEELGSISEESETTTITQNTNGTAEASCGEKKVISGGWKDNAPPTNNQLAFPYEDHRTNNGWKASARAIGTNRTITAYAYCLDL